MPKTHSAISVFCFSFISECAMGIRKVPVESRTT